MSYTFSLSYKNNKIRKEWNIFSYRVFVLVLKAIMAIWLVKLIGGADTGFQFIIATAVAILWVYKM